MANLADKATQVACTICAMQPLCHSRAVAHGAPSPVEYRQRVATGQALYASGSPRNAVYALRAGIARVSIPDAGRGRHTVRFLLPGDVVGLTVFAGGLHETEAVAIEDCEVCRIPAYRIEIATHSSDVAGAHLSGLLAREIAGGQLHAAALAQLGASERVARLLLDLSRRWAERGFSATHFRLPAGLRQLGEHLNLTPETVSRVLSEFRAAGWIVQRGREVEIRNPAALRGKLTPVAVRGAVARTAGAAAPPG